MSESITRRRGNLITIGNISLGIVLTTEVNSLGWREGEELLVNQTLDGKIIIEKEKTGG